MSHEDRVGDAWERGDEHPAAAPSVPVDSARGVEIRRFIAERLLAGDTEEEIAYQLGRRFGVRETRGVRSSVPRPTDVELQNYVASLSPPPPPPPTEEPDGQAR